MDVFDYFKYEETVEVWYGRGWSTEFPPGTKKRTFSVIKDYAKLVAQITPLKWHPKNASLSTNAANMSESQFQQMIEKGIREAEGQSQVPNRFEKAFWQF